MIGDDGCASLDDGSVIARKSPPTCKDSLRPFKIVTDDSFSPIPPLRVCVRGRMRARTKAVKRRETVIRHRRQR